MKLRAKVPARKIPTPNRPVVDYLRFVLPWAANPGDDHNLMFERARRRIQAEIENGNCKGSFAPRFRYRYVFVVPLPGGSKPIVRIGALDPVRQKGGISVETNPAKLESGDAEYFHEVMGRIVGRSYKGLLRRAFLNRIDFAVDIVHAHLDRMLVSYSGAQQCTVFGKKFGLNGRVETYNFGSHDSNYITAVYDKNIERRHRAIIAIAKRGLRSEQTTANFIKQLDQLHGAPPMVRVEVRGKKLNGLVLHDLDKLTNRFARFTIADLNADGSELPEKLKAVFISLCRDRGVKAALDHFKGTPDVRKVNKFWRSHRASWWNPEPMMEQALNVLRNCGIFAPEAFNPTSEGPDVPPLRTTRSRPATAFASKGGAKFKRAGPDLGEGRKVVRLGLENTESHRDSRGRIG
ncbi:hypothetical protein [Paraburkholderia silvatlantica]|uniref:hypothetical protein n=1 Tax=Paraburkholderia silvatlantica TaxID=321895 RepID=UPI00105E4919|nr:hypothetical protein [Paraburkholderia silvatlantica]TDQ93240.1 hypothetical protein C7412_109223 [Paraburkholderia silvatlantica]